MANIIALAGKAGSGKNAVADIIINLTTPKPDIFEEDEFGRPYKDGNNWALRTTKSRYHLKSFAYKLKQTCSLMTGIPVEDFDKQEVKASYLDSKWNIIEETMPCGCDWIMDYGHKDGICNNCDYPTEITRTKRTVRDLLVLVGSQMREVNPDVWVDAMFKDYICTHADRAPNGLDCPNWIITDLRIKNEYEAIKKCKGKIIRIERPCTECGLIKGHKMSCSNNKYGHYTETDLDEAEFDYTIINDGNLENLIRKVEVILKSENII